MSIGDSGSDNEPDEPDENNHSFNVNYSIKNGFDHQTKKSKLMVNFVDHIDSVHPSPSLINTFVSHYISAIISPLYIAA